MRIRNFLKEQILILFLVNLGFSLTCLAQTNTSQGDRNLPVKTNANSAIEDLEKLAKSGKLDEKPLTDVDAQAKIKQGLSPSERNKIDQQGIYSPIVIDAVNSPNDERRNAQVTYYFFLAIGLVCLGLAFFIKKSQPKKK